LNYHKIVARAYATFHPVPSETELQDYLREYADNSLLFVYGGDGQMWGQWDTPADFLPRYKTALDRRSPVPPEPAFTEWKKRYRTENKGLPKCFMNIPETLQYGVGVGGGVGDGVVVEKNTCASDDARGAVGLELVPLKPARVDEVKVWFDGEFWPMYPRKVSRPQALRAARRNGRTAADRVAIVECLRRRLPALQEQLKADGDYRPYPASWLNQQPWNDPEEAVRPAAATKSGGGGAVSNGIKAAMELLTQQQEKQSSYDQREGGRKPWAPLGTEVVSHESARPDGDS